MSVPTTELLARPVRRRGRPARVPASVIGSGLVVLFFVLAIVWPALLATHDPSHADILSTLQAPSGSHWLGTDAVGRDVYSRIVYGTRPSLLIGLGVMALGLAVAVVLGFASGLGPRWLAQPVNRVLEVLLAFPTLLLGLLFVALLGPSATSLIVAVGISTAPGYARLIRAQTLSVKGSAYVEAARALGHSRRTILVQHIAPNAFRPLVALVALGIGTSIVWASGLSFLGLGVAPPSPEWGLLLSDGRANITVAWWLEIFPGIAIVLVALSFTLIGRHLQDVVEGGRL
ncbi:peptide/nickel transport system permease protein [Jatrophihabitans endophyticus]|uniref:Peptide/nickel transport system permease protein n=1 Tax=Jatrophihabitans endophyticus TaxID=1206085 RepID=A0A1M5DRB6_9ACTN|nr:ABC transporter permease [Jatrophihabitans endophyticus]SHF69424.1 peptide/nickel transport system permease protein [Jatrophihabitans endophyticus]